MSEVALVTGARRGIGRAVAVALGERGMRVAVTSRTYRPADGEATSAGLDATVAAVEDAGGAALAVRLDIAERTSIDEAMAEVVGEWGHVDVLVNNALCDQTGAQARIAETDFAAFETMIVGEVVNTVYLTRLVLEAAAGRRVTVVNVGSAAAEHAPPAPIGAGGWAFSYAATKAALHRLAPFLQVEYGDLVRAFTVDPGFVRTEALLERFGDVPGSAPPELPASVIRWLALDPAADAHLGGYLHAQKVAADMGWVA